VGTLSTRADPANFAADLKLSPGITLSDSDRQAIANWLTRYGNPEAARYRADQMARIKAMLEQAQSLSVAMAIDPFEQAQAALLALEQVLPELADAMLERGESPRTALRPRYLELNRHWEGLFKAAQTAGIAKQYKRCQSASNSFQLSASKSFQLVRQI
jgi:streptomycin 6-kinase